MSAGREKTPEEIIEETMHQYRLRRSEEMVDQLEREGVLVWQVAAGHSYEVTLDWQLIHRAGGDRGAVVELLKKRAQSMVQAHYLHSCKIFVKGGAWVLKLTGSPEPEKEVIVILDEAGNIIGEVLRSDLTRANAKEDDLRPVPVDGQDKASGGRRESE